jgi:uncharacterized Tic20 family protein
MYYQQHYTSDSRPARSWAMVCHLSAFAGLLLPTLGAVLGPLVVWLLKRDEHPFIREQGAEAVNFQITMFLATLVAGLLVFVVIGIPLLWLLGIFNVVMVVVAAVRAHEGEHFHYPFSLRFVD